MLKSFAGIAILASVAGMAGCATRGETVGTAGRGASGGYGLSAGSAFSTPTGAVLGYEDFPLPPSSVSSP